MSSTIMKEFVTIIIRELKIENLLIIDSDVTGIVDLLLNDKDLDLENNYEINERL